MGGCSIASGFGSEKCKWLACLFLQLQAVSWLCLAYMLYIICFVYRKTFGGSRNKLKGLSVCRYLPQMWLNHKRRTTDGWNISNALTDMSGGFFSLAQQILDAYALQVGFSAHPRDLCPFWNLLTVSNKARHSVGLSSDFTILPWTQMAIL